MNVRTKLAVHRKSDGTFRDYDSITEEDMNVEYPVGFFFDMEHDDESFSDNFSKSSIETNDITSTLV